jgi:hypothetical protein
MRHTWLFLLFVASTAFAQSVNKLDADLFALSGTPGAAVTQQLTNDILSLVENNAQPSRRNVLDFADELMRALVGKKLPANSVSQLTAAILDVIHSDGVTTSKYRGAFERANQALLAMGVAAPVAKRVTGRLMVMGQEIRGPDDGPVRPVRVVR